MGKSSGGDSSGTVRYAPYLEAAHGRLLDHEGSDEPIISFIDAFNASICQHPGFTDEENKDLIQSPFSTYESIDVKEGFFGMRVDDPSITYKPKNYPGLWDIFGKLMAGADVHDLWAKVYNDVVQGPEIENVVNAQSEMLQDDIDIKIMPKFLGGMRDINSVQATTFIIGKAIIQTSHVKALNDFSTKLRFQAISISNEQWANHLKWNESVVKTMSEMLKLYYSAELDINKANLEYQAKDIMWDINLFENARGIIGAMGGNAATSGANEPSQAQSALGGAISGAVAGYKVSGENPVGALIGGVLGAASSFL